jgi:hypothetical protein
MKLIEDLGMMFTKPDSKRSHHFGLYECPKCCTEFKCRIAEVRNGNRTSCTKCANGSNNAAVSFIEKSAELHNNKYDYSMVVYETAIKHVTIICPSHGAFLQTPNKHKSGRGCPTCKLEKLKEFALSSSQCRSIEVGKTYTTKCSVVHDNRYDYSLVEYKDSKTPIDIICLEHGIFQQIPANHKNGNGCPRCANNSYKYDKPAITYYLKVVYKDIIAYKIGITSRAIKERFSKSDLEKITVLKTWEFSEGVEAYDKEQRILRVHSEYKYEGEPLLSSGNTELFTIDILGLDYAS